MSIQYIGEHLFPGQLGNALVWIAFISGLIATVLFFMRFRKPESDRGALKMASRLLYIVQFLSILGVGITLYYIIFNHYFEYAYVWQYSSVSLPLKYIVSCFWAGQEGSFLVWAMLQGLIGLVLMHRAKSWEPSVMAVFTLSQVFLISMSLGVHIGGVQIGSSPFELLRLNYQDIKDSIFTHPDYLSMIIDGNGLNPLLENYWMIIHPPILFAGYALSLVPFSYAIAALIRGEYTSWLRPVIPWTLISLTMLGTGILLGGAWAYVSLTFGGFWAWDPVENSSLVPWLILMASLHFMLIARKQHFALVSAFIFASLGYIMVLYATYLTRSGVLADTSAHSFGENGLALQLIIYILVFFLLMVSLIGWRFRKIYEKKKEILLSREFWMFIGAFLIVLGAFQIMFTTSLPVFNKILGTVYAAPSNSVGFYNRWQMPFALLITGFIAFAQFLNYDENEPKVFVKKLLIPLGITALLCLPFIIWGVVIRFNYILFLFFILFAIISTFTNLLFKTSKPVNWGAMITHIGFGIFILGVLITFSNARTISTNTSGVDLGSEKSNKENLLLMKGDTLYMSGFYVTYVDKHTEGNITDYRVDFLKIKKGVYTRQFTLYPSMNRNTRMGNVYNPDTKHFIGRDYYTYISAEGTNPDYIVIHAILNPFISVLWLGAIIMITGIFWALIRRIRLSLS